MLSSDVSPLHIILNEMVYGICLNKTKYFVLRRFDEVCSEYNEVN